MFLRRDSFLLRLPRPLPRLASSAALVVLSTTAVDHSKRDENVRSDFRVFVQLTALRVNASLRIFRLKLRCHYIALTRRFAMVINNACGQS